MKHYSNVALNGVVVIQILVTSLIKADMLNIVLQLAFFYNIALAMIIYKCSSVDSSIVVMNQQEVQQPQSANILQIRIPAIFIIK